MGNYTIKDLERLSQVKAHTIRIWERRYGLLRPARSSTNIRRYSDDDLRKILNVSLLNGHGLKISKIAELTEIEIRERVLEAANSALGPVDDVENLILAMTETDEALFQRVVSQRIERVGFEETLTQLIHPFLRRVGLLWQAHSLRPGQEHFISNLIRQRTIVAINDCSPPERTDARSYLLFLPEGELHELGLLFGCYMIRKQGHRTVYLGQSVPVEDVVEIAAKRTPMVLVTSFVTIRKKEEVVGYLKRIKQHLPSASLLFFCSTDLEGVQSLPGQTQLTGLQDLQELVR